MSTQRNWSETMTADRKVDTLAEDPLWARSRARASAQREFYGHLTVYVLVCALFVILDVFGGTSGATFLGLDWAFWPIGGWGVAVILHAIRVFRPGSGWEERRAAKLYEQERQRGPQDFQRSDQ
ncbi:MAG: 2TM domain-containing protein [Acidimicrobiales bacterium]